MNKIKGLILVLLVSILTLSTVSCSKKTASLSGTIKIDGSSTVGPITQAVAEEFKKVNRMLK